MPGFLFLLPAALLLVSCIPQAVSAAEILEVRILGSSGQEMARVELPFPVEGLGSKVIPPLHQAIHQAIGKCAAFRDSLLSSTETLQVSVELLSSGMQNIRSMSATNDPLILCLKPFLEKTQWNGIPMGTRPFQTVLRIWGIRNTHESNQHR